MKLSLPCLALCSLLAACGDAPAGVDAGRSEPDAGNESDAAGDASPEASVDDAGATTEDDASMPKDAGLDAGDAAEAVPPPKCETVAPTSCDDPPTRFADIDGVLEEYCRSCHAGEFGGPWPLNSYEHVAAWQTDIRSAMLDCSMPPRDAGIAMPTEDRQLLLRWVRCGAPK